MKFEEYIDRPREVGVECKVLRVRRISIVYVELKVVLEKKLQDDVHWENVVVKVGTVTEVLDLQCDDLPRSSLTISQSIPMSLVNKISPRRADIGYAAVVGSVVDQ